MVELEKNGFLLEDSPLLKWLCLHLYVKYGFLTSKYFVTIRLSREGFFHFIVQHNTVSLQ